MGKPVEIEVFRVGTHTASDGRTFEFPPELIDEAIKGYDPEVFRVPLIVSHETGNYSDKDIVKSELAFGIVDSFRRVGDRVFAQFKKIAPEFKRWVEEGRLHSVSSSFYLPNSPSNPTPGKLAFRHVAALGVNPPAVKGMSPLELREALCFSDKGEGTASFSMPYGEPYSLISRLFRGLRDQLIDSEDLDTAEAVLPSEAILALEGMSGIRYVSSDILNGQVTELWRYATELQQQLKLLGDRCNELERRLAAKHGCECSHESEHPIFKENPTPNFARAMAEIIKTEPSMGDLKGFMKALEMGDDEVDLAQAYMDGSAEMPSDKKKKVAAVMGMSDREFDVLYKPDNKLDMSERLKELAELREANERLQRELIEQRAERRKAEIVAFLEGEKRNGRVTVGMLRSQSIEFGEKKESMNLISFMCSLNDVQLAFMKTLLSSLPQQVTFDEIDDKGEEKPPLSFAEVGELAKQKLRAAKAAGLDLTESQAVDQVLSEHGIRY